MKSLRTLATICISGYFPNHKRQRMMLLPRKKEQSKDESLCDCSPPCRARLPTSQAATVCTTDLCCLLQPSGNGCQLPDWYGREPCQHCVSVTHTKKKKWSLSMKHWRNAVRKTPCFTMMKWIFTSIPKLAQTGSYVGSKSAL